ncbi:hypothetical protein H8959_013884 [Pygathrix nigripes]
MINTRQALCLFASCRFQVHQSELHREGVFLVLRKQPCYGLERVTTYNDLVNLHQEVGGERVFSGERETPQWNAVCCKLLINQRSESY